MKKVEKTAAQVREELREELHQIARTSSPLQRAILAGKFKAQ